MDGFHYVDIFATKGIEYLFILVFLVLFVFFMRALLGEKHGNDDVENRRKQPH